MSNTHTRAAQVWAEIEAALLARGLYIRNEQRPALVRLIGDAMTGLPQHQTVVARSVAVTEPPRLVRRGRKERRTTLRIDNTIVDATLAAMLERSCSRRVGYDGDDAVGYQ